MKLASYLKNGNQQLAFYHEDNLYDTQSIDSSLPDSMKGLLDNWDEYEKTAKNKYDEIREGKHQATSSMDAESILAPVPEPTSCRDAYAFRQHVASARRNRGVDMIPEYDQFPIWYFTNHNAVQGPGDIRVMPDHLHRLDFELEASVVLCRKGRNFRAAEADQFIAGYMIMNDMSARLMQMEEMKLNLGPAKGKDFSTAIGPILVTPDELKAEAISAKSGHTGAAYGLEMKAWVNGEQVSQGNMGDMDWTFAEIIERCAYGADVYPGDVIGSGTVGTGCFLELNGTAKLNNPEAEAQWIKEGDVIEMEIQGLGRLKNTIVLDPSDFSLLAEKKNV